MEVVESQPKLIGLLSTCATHPLFLTKGLSCELSFLCGSSLRNFMKEDIQSVAKTRHGKWPISGFEVWAKHEN